ncbi:MAG: DUF805 domain-containing protein, partial [Wohlfahrtiimonas sp.]
MSDSQQKVNGAFDWYLEAFRNYANFSGRTQRRGYWYFVLFNFLIGLGCGVIDYLLATALGFGFVGMIYNLAVLVPTFALGARRLHDIGKSGWLQLLILIPLVGAIILIVWFATESTKAENQY